MLVVSINVGVGIHRLFTYVSMKAIYGIFLLCIGSNLSHKFILVDSKQFNDLLGSFGLCGEDVSTTKIQKQFYRDILSENYFFHVRMFLRLVNKSAR